MIAVAWAAIGLLGATLVVLAAALFQLVNRIDALGARLDARLDSLEGQVDALANRLDARIDALTERLDVHIQRHAG